MDRITIVFNKTLDLSKAGSYGRYLAEALEVCCKHGDRAGRRFMRKAPKVKKYVGKNYEHRRNELWTHLQIMLPATRQNINLVMKMHGFSMPTVTRVAQDRGVVFGPTTGRGPNRQTMWYPPGHVLEEIEVDDTIPPTPTDTIPLMQFSVDEED